MRVFVATSYSKQVNYDTGEVFPEYREQMETFFKQIEDHGHVVFSALRADDYKINDASPEDAFRLDEEEIDNADAMLAIVTDQISAGVLTEIGIAVAKNKKVVISHLPEHKLEYFNIALINAGVATELLLPLDSNPFK